ncbi:MAG: FGGY-family carbohydrate kinase [Planctomycetes bacterium]|nr:FGGY-family carbohydrate kinase [Planctomycetota bacterium]
MDAYLGIDVGTGSARAGVFDHEGHLLGTAIHPIQMWRPQPDFVEQSSDDIWRACCTAVRAAVDQAAVGADQIRGIGFDATCSLLALDADDQPVSVSPTGNDEQNVIVWMDHRAVEQAQRINTTNHEVLRFVGGVISPEMQSPKLCWLKENLPKSWQRAAMFFDLPDYLTYRATGDATRSLCTTVCKWTYLGHEQANRSDTVGRWDDSFWRTVGLDEFVKENYARIGQRIRPMGEAIGKGLTPQAADELNLQPQTPVGISIIDAHAGGLGVIGAAIDGAAPTPQDMEHRLALIGGTSSCHMVVANEARFIPGVWGPYFSAMIPDLWLNEAGQSATGALIDHVIFSHARSAELRDEAKTQDRTIYELLNNRLDALATNVEFPAALTKTLHVLPYFRGNRSPRADPTLRGMISGLTLGDTIGDLALLYLATIQAVAHGTRHIIDTLNDHGFSIDTIFACGGGTKNPVFLREHADITDCRIVLPQEPEAVLLGAAILGAVAGGAYGSLLEAMSAMSRAGQTITPSRGGIAQYHNAKHAVFHRMYDDQLAYRRLMDD